jgi:4'-phosphopantetheinyl transferase
MVGMHMAELPRRDVHVWSCALEVSDAARSALVGVLSEDERRRAERLRDPVLRTRMLVGRALLRTILAGYAEADPAALVFERGAHGKPRLASSDSRLRIRFSWSRSAGMGLVAVAQDREVGVDVERVEPRRAVGPIVDRLLAPADAAELRSLDGDRRTRRFFEVWTRQEAYAKALGIGLQRSSLGTPPPDGHWLSRTLPMPAGFVASLCVEGGGVRLRMLDSAFA